MQQALVREQKVMEASKAEQKRANSELDQVKTEQVRVLEEAKRQKNERERYKNVLKIIDWNLKAVDQEVKRVAEESKRNTVFSSMQEEAAHRRMSSEMSIVARKIEKLTKETNKKMDPDKFWWSHLAAPPTSHSLPTIGPIPEPEDEN